MATVTPARLGKLRLHAGRLAYVAPVIPHTPNPPDASIAGPLAVSWLCTPATYDVYVGTTTTPPLAGSTTSLGWVLPPLTLGVTYYWRVVARNPLGTATGPLWSFTAASPVAPTYIAPPNHSTNQQPALTLVWTHPLVAPGDVVFDVYFGPTPSAPLVQRRQTTRTYTPPTLRDGVDYYWRIVAVNNVGSATGPLWTFQTRNPTQGLITIGGIDVHARTRIGDIRIRDLLTDTPNIAQLTLDGTAPTLAQEVRIGLATLAGDDVIFGGYIDTVTALYEGVPENRAWRITCQDYVYGINRRKVRRRYSQQSATLIAQDLLARDAPAGYTGTQIQAGLPVVSGGIDFTEEDLTACFARLAQRIGGYWYVDYAKDIHLFLTEATDAPTVITAAARVLLDEPPITWTADLTQIRTRVFVEGGGSQARAIVAVGATSLPVTDASWYAPGGGLVVSGPQRIRYAGKGTVGGPAAPSGTGQSVVGNLGGGPYSYVTTQIIAGAESPLSAPSAPVVLPAVASPPSTLQLTPFFSGVAPPSTALTVAPFMSGVTAPTTSVSVAFVSTSVAPPTTEMGATSANGPTGEVPFTPNILSVQKVDIGAGTMHVPPGATGYSWRVTYTNARGETTGSGQMILSSSPNQSSTFNAELTIAAAPTGYGITGVKVYRDLGNFNYRLVGSMSHPGGGTFKDTQSNSAIGGAPILPTTNTTATPGTGGLLPGEYRWRVTFVVADGGENKGGDVVTSFTLSSPYTAVQLSNVPTSPDGRVVARRIYRTRVNTLNFYLEATINDNAPGVAYLSTKPDAQLGAPLPTIDTSGDGGLETGRWYAWAVTNVTVTGETPVGPWLGANVPAGFDQAQVSAIPIGPPLAIARRLYRATYDAGVWGSMLLVATINDNTTTAYLDVKTTAQLGKAAPTVNTTGGGGLVPGTSYWWLVTFGTASGETTNSPSAGTTMPANCDMAAITQIPTSPDGRVTKRKVYRYGPGGVWQLEATINDNTTTTFTSSKTDGALGATGLPPTNTTGSGALTAGSYWWTVKYVTATGESGEAAGVNLALPAGMDAVQVSVIPTSGDARVTKRRLFRTASNGSTFRLDQELADNTTTVVNSVKADSALGADMVPGNTTSAGGQIAVAGIAIGGGTTSARKLYRTESGGAAYKLVIVIPDNTTTTYQDNKSDASLGALAPLDEVTELVGIPASGPGSILYEIRQGDEVNVLAQCDDVAAQAALAALEGAGSTGIVEHYLQDRRLALSTASATGFADLKLFSRPLITVHFATRDPKTRSGKTVSITLPELSLTGDFTIQSVEIDQIDQAPGLFPRYTVTASSIRFSLEDVLRRLQLTT